MKYTGFALVLGTSLLVTPALARSVASSPLPAHSAFTGEELLKKNVRFWVDVYTQFSTRQGVIHDTKNVDKVYELIEVGAGSTGSKIRAAKKRWREALLSAHRKQGDLTRMNEDELKVSALFRDIDQPTKLLDAAHRRRLRFQLGQKDRFRQGLIDSGRYLPWMEEIFRREGLPVELTRLPFVESSFNLKARSKVGASGIWQFMRSTGKLYLNINDAVDERNDPIRATEAAAKLLKTNFESLKSWPLAVTAYNHGRKGMMRAVRRVGSDHLEDLVSDYRARSFGFASSNFFSGLLAAIEAERNAEKYFGKVEREPQLRFYEVPLPDPIRVKDLVRFLSLDLKQAKEFNPALTDAVWSNQLPMPKGYRLRLPIENLAQAETEAKVFLAGFERIPATLRGRSRSKSTQN